MSLRAPKPEARAERVSLWQYLRMFRRDILSAQPARLYEAWMAAFRTPFFQSYLINDPDLIREVLQDAPEAFPKSNRIAEGLRPLLGDSVFLTNGAVWARQRRIIDPAFERGRTRDSFPAMQAAAQAMTQRLEPRAAADLVEIEEVCAHAAADVIFRTLFSLPIGDAMAAEVFETFRAHQRSQPILNLGAFLPLPSWMPRGHRAETRQTAKRLRNLIAQMVATRQAEIDAGTAPQDLATKIMTTPDPETGLRFTSDEMVDQVAIFFLAGHETSASALAWALYLLSAAPEVQDRLRTELEGMDPLTMPFSDLSRLPLTRDVYREALRLYPPVPMMVREARTPRTWRKRAIRAGAQVVLSPWHLHRHTRMWSDPDGFDPDRWQRPETQDSQRKAYMPFSAGPRVCPGAGFAMAEGVLLLASVVQRFRFEADPDQVPVPEAHLTVRARHGIWVRITRDPP